MTSDRAGWRDAQTPGRDTAYLEDAGIAKVAAESGTTANNVRVKLHRARRALRSQLERSCGSCTENGCLDCTCGGPARHSH